MLLNACGPIWKECWYEAKRERRTRQFVGKDPLELRTSGGGGLLCICSHIVTITTILILILIPISFL